MKGLLISDLARESGVNKETVRYYESLGLIPAPSRNEAGFRVYPSETIEKIHFVKHAQSLGFTLREIGSILQLNADTGAKTMKQLALAKLQEVEQSMAQLIRVKSMLSALTCECKGQGSVSECPIIKSISTHEPKD